MIISIKAKTPLTKFRTTDDKNSKQTRDRKSLSLLRSESRSVVSYSVTPRTIQSREFSRPEYWSG